MDTRRSLTADEDRSPDLLSLPYSGSNHFDWLLTVEASGLLLKSGIDFWTDWYTPQPKGTAIQIHAHMSRSFFIDQGLRRFNAVKPGMNGSHKKVGYQADDQQTCHHVHGGVVGLGFWHTGLNF